MKTLKDKFGEFKKPKGYLESVANFSDYKSNGVVTVVRGDDLPYLQTKSFLDFSLPLFELEHVPFLTYCSNCKGIDLSNNFLVQFSSSHFELLKLKHLIIDNNFLQSVYLSNLPNLVSLSLKGNRLTQINDVTGLLKLVRLELSGNQIKNFKNIGELISLRYLDLSNNDISLSFQEMSDKILVHMKKLKNLKCLILSDNPITNFPDYRDFIIHELPQLKYLDNSEISKKQRMNAGKKAKSGKLFENHLTTNEEESSSNLSERRSVILRSTISVELSIADEMAESIEKIFRLWIIR
eukprot:TRINITY_DN9813_c0_g1_i1.p1 TRINITY_DN9813_c0_g1~~TRINITY_DN9813_c0_g1_i1.p1  ORF type:complete len:295 (-),score=50.66 TRINITY_DN9813_c0_g1_i1:218-1102(-)